MYRKSTASTLLLCCFICQDCQENQDSFCVPKSVNAIQSVGDTPSQPLTFYTNTDTSAQTASDTARRYLCVAFSIDFTGFCKHSSSSRNENTLQRFHCHRLDFNPSSVHTAHLTVGRRACCSKWKKIFIISCKKTAGLSAPCDFRTHFKAAFTCHAHLIISCFLFSMFPACHTRKCSDFQPRINF